MEILNAILENPLKDVFETYLGHLISVLRDSFKFALLFLFSFFKQLSAKYQRILTDVLKNTMTSTQRNRKTDKDKSTGLTP